MLLVSGEAIADYGFGEGPLDGRVRYDAFTRAFAASPAAAVVGRAAPRPATRAELETFHTPRYIDFVREQCARGTGLLDGGDTPAKPWLYDAARNIVGATLVAVEAVMSGAARRAFVPCAGHHHAAPDNAAGFCVFNDCAIAIKVLRRDHGLKRVAYVDIDGHHGDGVFYGFVSDPDVAIADVHEDGRYLYPGTGHADETGLGAAKGTKLNLPLPPEATDRDFMAAWDAVERHLDAFAPECVILQSGSDGLAEDPLTHLRYTEAAHGHAARRLAQLADGWGHGRVIALGGGGIHPGAVARAWTQVVEGLCE